MIPGYVHEQQVLAVDNMRVHHEFWRWKHQASYQLADPVAFLFGICVVAESENGHLVTVDAAGRPGRSNLEVVPAGSDLERG